MATANPVQGLRGPAETARKITGWYIGFAVLFIILGIISIAEPMMAALAVALLVGWLLIFAGGAHLVSAFSGGGAGRVIWQVLIGIVYLVGGFYFLTHPLLSVGTLTLVLAGIILAEGVFEIIAYFKTRSSGASVWLLINGLITLLLGGLIWFHWPSSSVWAIGILLGVNLLMTGMTRLMFGLAARKVVKHITA
ncbi:MAG: DUF308 domain-containing protein [Candidatus Acidiferrum sp.]